MVPDRVRLPVTFDAAGLQADALGLSDGDWVPHFNKGCYEGDWAGAPMRSVGGIAGRIYPDPTANDDYADTPLLERCPHVHAALSWFECPLLAVRYLRLGPGARILEHTDLNLGFDDGEVRIHVPVVTNGDVSFVLAGSQLAMAEGEAWYLDLNQRHAVCNDGSSARIHLVIDCEVNPWLAGVIESS